MRRLSGRLCIVRLPRFAQTLGLAAALARRQQNDRDHDRDEQQQRQHPHQRHENIAGHLYRVFERTGQRIQQPRAVRLMCRAGQPDLIEADRDGRHADLTVVAFELPGQAVQAPLHVRQRLFQLQQFTERGGLADQLQQPVALRGQCLDARVDVVVFVGDVLLVMRAVQHVADLPQPVREAAQLRHRDPEGIFGAAAAAVGAADAAALDIAAVVLRQLLQRSSGSRGSLDLDAIRRGHDHLPRYGGRAVRPRRRFVALLTTVRRAVPRACLVAALRRGLAAAGKQDQPRTKQRDQGKDASFSVHLVLLLPFPVSSAPR